MDSTNVFPITVHPNPDIDFSKDKAKACLGDVLRLTDRSTDYEGGLQHWYWNMGDNTMIDQPNHNYVYTSPGDYQISYVVKSVNGCLSDTLNTTFKVYPYPDVEAGEDLYVLEGNSISLPGSVNGSGVSFYWTPSQYLNSTSILNPICTPIDDITYTLAASADGGCRREDRIKVIGYVTSNWKGSFEIPGFIYDQAVIKSWEPWTDYKLGDIVKHKEFYYSANTFLVGTYEFESNSWTLLADKPTPEFS